MSIAQIKGVQHLTLEKAAEELGMGTTKVATLATVTSLEPSSPPRMTTPEPATPLALQLRSDATTGAPGAPLQNRFRRIEPEHKLAPRKINFDTAQEAVNKPGVAADPFPTVDSESQENQSLLDENLPRRCLLFSARGKR